MQITAVIPTCNRKKSVLFLLDCLNKSSYVLKEVIVVDSGEDRLHSSEIAAFSNLHIQYLTAEKSVCIQRNRGIHAASSEWIFLCDDDIEVPADYLDKLVAHIKIQPQVCAVSGLFLQVNKNEWTAKYSITSLKSLLWLFIFKLSIWGEINVGNSFFAKEMKRYYQRKGNCILQSGWPVITNFSEEYFIVPLYSLGASLVPKLWLINSPFDEVLDSHGIGEHYGVIAGFPSQQIHVLNNAFVYHHHEETNRLQKSLQYYRRVLALDYFRRTKKELKEIKKFWLLWSLFGSLLLFALKRNSVMIKAVYKAFTAVLFNKNVYWEGYKHSKKLVQPKL